MWLCELTRLFTSTRFFSCRIAWESLSCFNCLQYMYGIGLALGYSQWLKVQPLLKWKGSSEQSARRLIFHENPFVFDGPEVARLHSREEARRNDLGNSKPHSDTFGVEFPNAHSDRSEKSLKSRKSRQSSYPTRPFETISVLKKQTSSLIDVH